MPYDNINQVYVKSIKDSITLFAKRRNLCIIVKGLPNSNNHLSSKYFYNPRKRYLATLILKDMEKKYKNGDTQVSTIYLTDKDISMPLHGVTNYGIIGLASYKSRVAIVSTHRVSKNNVWKAVLHEFCHTKGIKHCNNNECIMASGNGKGDFTNKHSLCPEHEKLFSKVLKEH